MYLDCKFFLIKEVFVCLLTVVKEQHYVPELLGVNYGLSHTEEEKHRVQSG